jgi:hypothetical protein
MPKKSKRIASRQAQLSGRSKRTRSHGPSGIPLTSAAENISSSSKTAADSAVAMEEPRAVVRAEAGAPAIAQPRTPRLRSRGIQVKPVETYFFPEVRRIGIASGIVFAILIALVFVLPQIDLQI